MSQQQCLAAFQACTSWEQRARLLLQYGQKMPVFDDIWREQASLIRGCESPVWCRLQQQDDKLFVQLDTDARLLRGLLAVLLVKVNSCNPQQLQNLDFTHWFTQLGLQRQLSVSRSNGLRAVLEHIAACASQLA